MLVKLDQEKKGPAMVELSSIYNLIILLIMRIQKVDWYPVEEGCSKDGAEYWRIDQAYRRVKIRKRLEETSFTHREFKPLERYRLMLQITEDGETKYYSGLLK